MKSLNLTLFIVIFFSKSAFSNNDVIDLNQWRNLNETQKELRNSKKISNYDSYELLYEETLKLNSHPTIKKILLNGYMKMIDASDDLETGKITERKFKSIKRKLNADTEEELLEVQKKYGNQALTYGIKKTYDEALAHCEYLVENGMRQQYSQSQQRMKQDLAISQQKRASNPSYKANINCSSYGNSSNCQGNISNSYNPSVDAAEQAGADFGLALGQLFNELFQKPEEMKKCMAVEGHIYE